MLFDPLEFLVPREDNGLKVIVVDDNPTARYGSPNASCWKLLSLFCNGIDVPIRERVSR